MTKPKQEASRLKSAAVAGVIYIGFGAALAAGGFFTPHSLAREAGLVSGAHAEAGQPYAALMTTAHHVVIAGHVALTTSLHLAMVAVHECLQLVSAVFGI